MSYLFKILHILRYGIYFRMEGVLIDYTFCLKKMWDQSTVEMVKPMGQPRDEMEGESGKRGICPPATAASACLVGLAELQVAARRSSSSSAMGTWVADETTKGAGCSFRAPRARAKNHRIDTPTTPRVAAPTVRARASTGNRGDLCVRR